MYIYSLDTPLSRSGLSPALKGQSKSYGTSMLKLSLLLGWSPIVSENQIVDCRLILTEAATNDDFVELLRGGHIRLSVFSKTETYRKALHGFLERPQWISSAWDKRKRGELVKFLDSGGPMSRDNWDAEDILLYKGLARIDGLRTKGAQLVPAGQPGRGFLERIESYYQNLPQRVPETLVDTAKNVSTLLHNTRTFLANEKLQDRSAWLTVLGSEFFRETHEPHCAGGAWEAAFLAVLRTYNDVLCDSVAGGVGLKSLAFAPVGAEEEVSDYPILTADDPVSSGDGAPDAEGMPIRSIVPFDETQALGTLDKVSWSVVKSVISAPEFHVYLRDARGNAEARKPFLDWLSNEVGLQVAAEYDAANRPTIKVGSRVIAGAGLYVLGGAKLILLDAILYLFDRRTFSDLVAGQLAALAGKEIGWRVSGSMKTILSSVAVKS